MGAKNRVKLTIADCEFFVASEDSEEYILKTGASVDEYIRNIMSSAPNMSTTLAAMLAALDFCDKAAKEKAAADNLRSQIKACFDEAAELRDKLEKSEAAQKAVRDELLALKTRDGLKAFEEQRNSHAK